MMKIITLDTKGACTMEYVILGFLLLKSFTQYDLYKALQKKVSPFYSPSLGSIQSALKKLEILHFISVDKRKENGKSKNIYTIEKTGEVYFKSWMLQGLSSTKFEAETSTKLFFLGLLSKDDRKQVVDTIISFLDSLVQSFEQDETEFLKKEVEQEKHLIVKYQLKTLSLGKYNYRQSLEWFIDLRKEMESE
jgi:DNA-binding PadR family transcriptional regulator